MSLNGREINKVRRSSSEEDYSANGHFMVARDAIRDLSKTNAIKSLYHILSQWFLLGGAIIVCQHFWNPLFYLVAVAFIGARQHALLVLMHEGTHYRLFRNKRLNDGIAELLLAWPLLIELQSYRRNHLAHHQHLNSSRDPDWQRKSHDPKWFFPKRPIDLFAMFVADLFGLGVLGLIQLFRSLSRRDTELPRSLVIAKVGFYAVAMIAIISAGFGKAFLLYWVVPFSTWLIMIMHLRSIAEHFAIESGSGAFRQIRTTRAGWFARMFVAPENVNYHLEHHLFPSVPCYRLPELHSLLWSNAHFRSSAHVTPSYFGVLRECVRAGSFADQNSSVRVDPLLLTERALDLEEGPGAYNMRSA